MKFERFYCNCFASEYFPSETEIEGGITCYECAWKICDKDCYYKDSIEEMILEGIYCPIWIIEKLYDKIYCDQYECEAIKEILNFIHRYESKP